ncbi:Proline-serine-threonine phosphatase-interacting protein 2 [Apophysomyces ossiformis]|uniref:Proline-serine-threonine phosphatase-interacting protein 2 n=1 Tax=Apophysomyces ossiformis TaxID=679940 RepID=A0A8H7BHM6_9FUNG|nr:Proline-serine-threonine phosphatase-interacting protein 2 [Apophysomyces ossiformis]
MCIEEEYGEKLLKLSQINLAEYEEPSSTFAESLHSIPTATEAAARAHLDLAQQIHQLLQTPLAGFMNDQKQLRKTVFYLQADMESLNLVLLPLDSGKSKKIAEPKTVTLRKPKKGKHKKGKKDDARTAYITECDRLAELRRKGKDYMQLQQRIPLLDQEYRLSGEMLESVTASWIEEWRMSCNAFQKLEESRIDYLRRTLWSYTHMMASVYVVDDQACEQIRAALENVDIGKDMNLFISNHNTGTNIPDIPKYSQYVDQNEAIVHPIREINIPVMDEELRSVNDQLKKLPPGAGSMHKTVPPVPEMVRASAAIHIPTPTDPDLSDDTALTSDLQRNKALPSLPQDRKLTKMEHYYPEQDALDQPQRSSSFPLRNEPSSFRPVVNPIHTGKSWHDINDDIQYDGRERSGTFYEPIVRQQTPANYTGWQRRVPLHSPVIDSMDGVSETVPFPLVIRQNGRKKAMFSFLNKKKPQTPTDEIDERPRHRRFSIGFFSKKESPTALSAPQLKLPQSPTSPLPETDWQKVAVLRDGTPVIEYVRALWNYEAKIEPEMSFSKNDIFAIIEKKKDGWWNAEIVSGDNHGLRGLVPGNFMCTV